ncbi:MAG: hypothetical protein WA775_14935 [Psychroserpens sp.]|uniref:hypothetical protein n=1 Tax=Psychroserpens sp. TaxID=2020870 RepID=UPI003C75E70F
MKSFFTFFGVCLLLTSTCFAQVGIGIEVPDPSSILHLESTEGGLLLPKLTTVQRDAITDPANGLTIYNLTTEGIEVNTSIDPLVPAWELLSTVDDTKPVLAPSVTTVEMNALPTTTGSIVFNTTEDCLFQYKAGNWQSLCEAESSKIVTIYKDLGGEDMTGDSTFRNFPIGAVASEVKEIDSDYFTVLGDGRIQVLEAGSYSISASWAVRNLKIGTRKYIFAIFRGSERLGYLTRGFATIPDTVSGGSDFFGASGTFQFRFNANDIIDVQYWINAGTPSAMDGDLLHIGIIKL